MAAEYLVSTEISSLHTVPFVPNSSTKQGPGRVDAKLATVTTVTASAGSTYRFMGIPSGARLVRLILRNDALTGITSADIGLAEPVPAGTTTAAAATYANSTAANQYLFKQAADIHAVNLAGTDYAFAVTVASAAAKPLWDLAGYTADPTKYLDLIVTINANSATPTAGTMALFAEYVKSSG